MHGRTTPLCDNVVAFETYPLLGLFAIPGYASIAPIKTAVPPGTHNSNHYHLPSRPPALEIFQAKQPNHAQPIYPPPTSKKAQRFKNSLSLPRKIHCHPTQSKIVVPYSSRQTNAQRRNNLRFLPQALPVHLFLHPSRILLSSPLLIQERATGGRSACASPSIRKIPHLRDIVQ